MISVEGNPNIKRCPNGHYFEIQKHTECPYCQEEYKSKNSSIVINTVRSDISDNDEKTEIIFMDK